MLEVFQFRILDLLLLGFVTGLWDYAIGCFYIFQVIKSSFHMNRGKEKEYSLCLYSLQV